MSNVQFIFFERFDFGSEIDPGEIFAVGRIHRHMRKPRNRMRMNQFKITLAPGYPHPLLCVSRNEVCGTGGDMEAEFRVVRADQVVVTFDRYLSGRSSYGGDDN